jgi:murein DD-endopeptidase MepM/ murein hydrolase activator NlpD
MKNRTTRLLFGLLVVASAATAVRALLVLAWRTENAVPPPAVSAAPPAPPPDVEVSVPVRSGDTFAGLLLGAGLDEAAAGQAVAAVQKAFDVRALRAGSELKLIRAHSGTLKSLEYSIDPDRVLTLSHNGEEFAASVQPVPSIMRTVPVSGVLEGSLFESIERTGESPELAIRMAEIFAWDLDFYTDPQPGDEFVLLVEKKEYENAQASTYGRILAAKYRNARKSYEGFLFPDEDGKPRYYSEDGRSLQSAFLRSPIKFDVRISSRFSRRRFHPVLRRYRPHLGTDYAAPRGTPVQAVAAGRVTFSGRSGGSGNMVRIQHSGGFETYYLHLSRRYVRRGQRVEQGQRIGAVGSTGLATGPHLDFRIRRNGRFIDFQRLELPRERRVAAARTAEFAAARDGYRAQMAGGASETAVASAAEPAPLP